MWLALFGMLQASLSELIDQDKFCLKTLTLIMRNKSWEVKHMLSRHALAVPPPFQTPLEVVWQRA